MLDQLGAEASGHERFGTASLELGGRRIDLARTRRESYPAPGALPEVAPASIRIDLARRDFTINAMAVPLRGEAELIDPYDGADRSPEPRPAGDSPRLVQRRPDASSASGPLRGAARD